MKIMVVDDDGTTRKILGIYLKQGGFESVFAVNGLDALEKLATHEVNLVLTDLNMPYMDGIELIKTIKSTPSLNHLPVLMVTTENDDVEREKAYSAGANGYMVKPVTASAVSENIKKILKSIIASGKEVS